MKTAGKVKTMIFQRKQAYLKKFIIYQIREEQYDKEDKDSVDIVDV